MVSISGIYVITNAKSGKVYIGQAQDIYKRWGEHKRALKRGDHGNKYLQRAWNKHGIKAFKFQILERCLADQLDEREQHYLNIYMPRGICYNIAPEAGTTRGKPCSEETKRKISIANSGRVTSPETKQKISDALKGRPLNDNQHHAIVKSNATRNISDTVKKHIATFGKAKKGVKHTPEHAQKISESLMGHKHSDETKKKLSESAKKRYAREREQQKDK